MQSSLSIAVLVLLAVPSFNGFRAMNLRNKISSHLRASRINMAAETFDDYTIAILGDLHFDPRFMDDHNEGQEHFNKILVDGKRKNAAVVSLVELGESKTVF